MTWRLPAAACVFLAVSAAHAATRPPVAPPAAPGQLMIRVSEDSASGLVLKAQAYLRDGKLPEAREALLEHLRRFGPTAEVFTGMSEAERRQGRAEAASDFARRAIELMPALAPAHHAQGLARYDLGDDAGALAAFDEALRLQPGEAVWLLDRGNAKDRLQDYAGALADYDAALALRPDWPVPLANRAIVLVRQEKWAEAEAEARKALALDPRFGDAYRNLGYALQGQGNTVDALQAFEDALANGALPADILRDKAVALERLNSFDQALKTADEALNANPAAVDMAVLKLRVTNAKGQSGRIPALVKQALARHLAAPADYVTYAQGLSGIGQKKLAHDVLRAADKKYPASPDVLLELGWAAYGLDRKDEALGVLTQLTEIAPQRGANWADRASIESELGRHEEALKHFDQAIALEPDNALIHYNKGWAHLRMKDMLGALSAMLEGHRLDPNNLDINIDLGYVADVVSNYPLSEKHSRLALAAAPDNVTALTNLSDLLARDGRLAEAQALAERARSIEPKNPELIVAVAFVALQQGDVPRAAGLMKEARGLQSKKRTASYYYVLGLLREKQNRPADARENYGLVLKSDPNAWYQKHAERGLERLR